MKTARSLFFVTACVCLLVLPLFLIKAEMTRSERRLMREASRRIELRKNIDTTKQEIIGTARRIDMLVELNADSIAFFNALHEFDERNSNFVFAGPRLREAVYGEYYQILLGFYAKYAALNVLINETKQRAASPRELSLEDELRDLLLRKQELDDQERAFSELVSRFGKLAESVFSGADGELSTALGPYYLKLTSDRAEYSRARPAVPRDH